MNPNTPQPGPDPTRREFLRRSLQTGAALVVTGGMGGGSCWGDEPYRMGSDPEEFIDLATLFDRVCPAMTYRQHSSVMGAVLETTYGTEYEYYGNYTDYGIKRVNYRRLYDALVAEGLISGD